MEIPVVDLHCDLLSFLTYKSGRTIEDRRSRASYPQLKQGGVKLQTLSIYSMTDPHSVDEGRAQVEYFCRLTSQFPTFFARYPNALPTQETLISILPAFENASTFASETEPLTQALKRLDEYHNRLGPISYISLTWNEENRFGGGNASQVGLKEDGKRLLEWMDGKQIAADLSHTSDRLAHELIDFIDRNDLDIPIIASHSNFRLLSNYPRNLPEDLAKEIIRRKGLIGLNFFAPFIHDTDPSTLLRHIEYGLSLGGENTLCFGADFFCDTDFPPLMQKYQRQEGFYPELADASAYPALLKRVGHHLRLSDEQLLKIASKNALRFLQEKITC